MKRRVSICLLSAMLLAMAGIAPAAAQSFDGEVLLATPSLDEVCGLLEGLDGGEGLGELEELFGGVEGLAGFEPEPVDDAEYAELSDALQTILDEDDDALAVTAMTDGQMLVVTITPDITQCEGLEDLDTDGELGSGTFLIQPTVDEFCSLIDDTLADLEDLDDEPVEGDGTELDEDLGAGLEGFLPVPVDEADRGPFEAVGAALSDLLDGAEDADEASATFDGDTLVVSLAPGIERCEDVVDDIPDSEEIDEEVADEVADEAPAEEAEEIPAPTQVPSGLGVSASGPTLPVVMAAFGLLFLALGGGLATRRTRA